MYQKNRKRGLVIIGVDIAQDERPAALRFVERYKLTYPVGQDVSGEIASRYAVKGTPTLIYIDRTGRLQEWVAGAMSPEAFRQRIKDFLK